MHLTIKEFLHHHRCDDQDDRDEPSRPVPTLPPPNAVRIDWSRVSFGRHNGETLLAILFNDPDYFFWACEERAFNRDFLLAMQAEMLYRRARAIRLRPGDVAQYIVVNGRFEDVQFIPEAIAGGEGRGEVLHLPYLDMGMPRDLRNYDKGGYEIMLRAMKEYFLGPRKLMTQRRADAFFTNDKNFINP